MAHLSRWLADGEFGPGELTAARVQQFLKDRRASGRVHRRLTLRGLRPLLGYLRSVGVMPEPAPPIADGPLEQLLAAFHRHLVDERGLADSTVGNYCSVAEGFLSTRVCERAGDGLRLGDLTANDVITFVLAEAARHSAGSLNNVATGLRALLRFLHVHGDTTTSLAQAVPAAPGWRDGGLPRAVEPGQVARLLAGCDRRTSVGRRDFAILTVLVRLGLRAGELAALNVDDVDWRAGELLVCGKGNRRERLPLPHDVGQAIADYCWRGRRRGACRGLFLRVNAPHTALSASGISEVVATSASASSSHSSASMIVRSPTPSSRLHTLAARTPPPAPAFPAFEQPEP